MPKVTFTLRVLTPLFLAGANPNADDLSAAELRAPSFRGLMRYWQRALVGSLSGATQQSLATVKQAETALFGATDKGSAVAVKVSAASNQPRAFTEKTAINVGGKWQATGKGYLFWSMARSGKPERGNLKPARWYFPPGTSFQVTLSTRGADAARLDQAIATFWLLTQLGGLGSRSRRCAGSLAVESVEGQNTTALPFTVAENAQTLKGILEQGLKEVRSIAQKALPDTVKGSLPSISPQKAEFDILASGVCRI